MHSQWLDETNKTSFRTLYHYTIGLPTSLFYIRKRFSSAQTWFNLVANKSSYTNEQQNRVIIFYSIFVKFLFIMFYRSMSMLIDVYQYLKMN
jgi:hypothetical protein